MYVFTYIERERDSIYVRIHVLLCGQAMLAMAVEGCRVPTSSTHLWETSGRLLKWA